MGIAKGDLDLDGLCKPSGVLDYFGSSASRAAWLVPLLMLLVTKSGGPDFPIFSFLSTFSAIISHGPSQELAAHISINIIT